MGVLAVGYRLSITLILFLLPLVTPISTLQLIVALVCCFGFLCLSIFLPIFNDFLFLLLNLLYVD